MLNEIAVQKYLRSHSFEQLLADHGVRSRACNSRPEVWSLNYDQFAARHEDDLARDCRGLVLRTKVTSRTAVVGDTTILARPMRRFFNFGTPFAADVDLAHARVFEKMDGTLIILYYDRTTEKWCVATRAVPDASVSLDGHGTTFRALFEATIERQYQTSFKDFCASLRETFTYSFELTTPENQVVVNYPKPQAHLLAVINTLTGYEYDIREFAYSLNVCPSHDFMSIDELQQFVASRDPHKFEGLVLCDQEHRRVKLKNESYMALNGAVDSLIKSPRNMMNSILNGSDDDAEAQLPEYLRERLYAMRKGLQAYFAEVERIYWLHHTTDRKAFVLAVCNAGFSRYLAPMMAMFTGQVECASQFYCGREDITTTMVDFLIQEAKDRS